MLSVSTNLIISSLESTISPILLNLFTIMPSNGALIIVLLSKSEAVSNFALIHLIFAIDSFLFACIFSS